jgi:long-subunit acyl-CoA synthetase (AMP-forming)
MFLLLRSTVPFDPGRYSYAGLRHKTLQFKTLRLLYRSVPHGGGSMRGVRGQVERGEPATVAQGLRATAARLPDVPAVTDLDGVVGWTWAELLAHTDALAGGLRALGVRRGRQVALLLSNRPEFHLVDLAVLTAGGTPFSVYPTSTVDQIRHLLIDSEAMVIVTEAAQLDRILAAAQGLVPSDHIVVVDDSRADARVRGLGVLMALDPGFDGAAAVAEIDPEDLVTIIYTSGTTGPPKGVQLSHRNILAATRATMELSSLPEGGRALSWLPAAHIAERHAHHYLPVLYGLTITTCSDPARLVPALRQVRPHWFFAVPRVWEKLRSALDAALEAESAERWSAARRAIDAGLRRVALVQAGHPVPEELDRTVDAADTQFFRGWREELGLHESLVLNVGAAPCSTALLEYFHAIGLPVAEMWGMSETCGCGAVNRRDEIRIGTAGPPTPGVEIRLDADGEILVRGDVVTRGYRNQPEATAAALDNHGWLRTGDLGALDERGFLRIVDRKKDIIINSAGQNMSPALIETTLTGAHPLIGHAVCVGDARRYNTALLVLDPVYAPAWARRCGLPDLSLEELARRPEVREELTTAVLAANAHLARVEQIKAFAIVSDVWTPGSEELTPTQKLRRRPIERRYAATIAELYGEPTEGSASPAIVVRPPQMA